ncbi:MAG: hypothetical protein QM503_04655 [Bacteroidota bacterium]
MPTLQQIDQYFLTNGIPVGDVKLAKATIVTDPVLFVESSISTLKHNSDKKVYQPYFNRLVKYYEIVKLK